MARYSRIKRKADITETDEFISFWERVYIWASENTVKAIFPAIALVLVGMVMVGTVYYVKKKDVSAQKALYFALLEYPRDGQKDDKKVFNPSASSKMVESLDSIASHFAGSAGAMMAELYKANLLYSTNQMEKAEESYRKIVDADNQRGVVVSSLASIGLAMVYQNQGKYDESTTELAFFLNEPNAQFGGEMSLITARNLELKGDKSGATAKYEEFLATYPNSGRTLDVHHKISQLKQ